MDMQGTPIGSTNKGMKNSSDPAAKFASIHEPTGAVTSDSLAASSSKFQRSNPTEPLNVEGDKSNFANTDTSGATTLPPTSSTSARGAKLEDQEVRYPEATGGVPQFAGNHNADGTYSGGSTQAQEETKRSQESVTKQHDTGNTTASSENTASGMESISASSEHPKPANASSPSVTTTSGSDPASHSTSADPAPSYVANLTTANVGKPKGKNLTEGGFEDDNGKNNASYNADVGSEDDPGRVAQQGFQKLNAATAGSSAGPQEQSISREGTYDALGAENEA